MSKKLISQVTKVVESLNENGFTFLSEDNCEDELDYIDVEGKEIIVGDDNNRETWNVTLNKVKGPTDLRELLISVLGKPDRIQDDERKVLNWEPDSSILIVYFDDSIEFCQYYTKQ